MAQTPTSRSGSARAARRFFAAFDFTLHGIVGLIVLCLAIIGVLQVFFRYVAESSLAWTEELSRVLLIWLVLLAAAAELQRGAHIAMKLLVAYFPARLQRFIERANLLLIFCFAVILTVYGIQLASSTMAQSATILPISMGQVYMALPIGGAAMALNALRLLWSSRRITPAPAATGDVV
jgi:TRAP-type C4-dicarboxylate transport system permease small subunit